MVERNLTRSIETVLPAVHEPETQMLTTDETTRMPQPNAAEDESQSPEKSKNCFRGPKERTDETAKGNATGPATKNSTDAASNALKKYFRWPLRIARWQSLLATAFS